MKRITYSLLAFLMIAVTAVKAQTSKTPSLDRQTVAKLDVSGKWVGKRMQYSWDHKSFIEVFEYEFDLKQEGNIVTGTSTILTSNGEYGDMRIEGVIVGNQLIFAEKEVKSAIRPEGKVWCLKSGSLSFKKDGDNLTLSGETSSFMEVYNYPCSGGVTELKKVDNSNNLKVLQTAENTVSTVEDNMQISVFPNPFVESATISYNLTKDSKVNVEVYDMTGRNVSNLYQGNQKAGNYTVNFDAKSSGFMSGIFIVKMTINGDVFSRQIVQMR